MQVLGASCMSENDLSHNVNNLLCNKQQEPGLILYTQLIEAQAHGVNTPHQLSKDTG